MTIATTSQADSNTEYWSGHNVTSHAAFSTRGESLEYVKWRNAQNLFRERYMPASGHDGETILDYGCGPGNDVVNFLEFSAPARIVATDISPVAIGEAGGRIKLHPRPEIVEFVCVGNGSRTLPFRDGQFDYVHCDGVLHHTPNPEEIIAEFRRVLKTGGIARIMVYHYESIWLHHYAAYSTRIVDGKYRDMPVREAFARTTDGESCPIANCYTAEEFCELCERAGFPARFLGCGIDLQEMIWLPQRFAAMANPELPSEHRDFLRSLTFDERGVPLHNGRVAGVSAFFECVKR